MSLVITVVNWYVLLEVGPTSQGNLRNVKLDFVKIKEYPRRLSDMPFKGLLNGHLDSPQSKFQISNSHLPRRKLGFFLA
jgi:hypothetical protein